MKSQGLQFAQTPQGIVVGVILGTLMWKVIGSSMVASETSVFKTWTGALVIGAGIAGLMYYVGSIDMKV